MQEKKFPNKPKWVEFVDQIILTLGFMGFLFFFLPMVLLRIRGLTSYYTNDPALERKLDATVKQYRIDNEGDFPKNTTYLKVGTQIKDEK